MQKNPSTVDRDALQAQLVQMLAWFHDYCVKHDLRYYIICGTMLGAVRHQGFIPWDDDVDVAMPREDYRKLESLMGQKQHGRYVLETPRADNLDYLYPYAKIYDITTTLTEHTRAKIKRGVFLDIFPLDGAGDSEEEVRAMYKPIKTRRELLLTLSTGVRKGRSWKKNLAVVLMRVVPNWVACSKKLQLSLEKQCGCKCFDECRWGGNLVGILDGRELMPRHIYGKPTEYCFEGLTVYGPEDYEGYLTKMYGDWRQLPPVEKRETHHDFIEIDLEKSYML